MASVSTVKDQVAAGAAAPRYRFSAAEFLQARPSWSHLLAP